MTKRTPKAKRSAAPKVPRQVVRQVRAKYDAAQTTDENRRHWALADGLSADSANSPAVRRQLRNRARYEVANNSYAWGICDTLAIDCVGTGPRLQMSGKVSDEDAQTVEDKFAAWMRAVGLSEKLRTMRFSRSVDGEVFGMMTNNPQIPDAVQLDLRLLEAEQVASNSFGMPEDNAVDGIQFDQFGNPVSYNVLKQHPGSSIGGLGGESFPVPAAQMIHFFIPKRPGQRRGIPSLTPALPLFAQLRRWTLSVLAAAETASDFAALLYTDQPPDGEAADADPFDRVEIERRAMMTLPAGYKMEQLKAEHPTSTYKEFKLEILDEICRCELIPANLGRGNSSGFNFSSAKLDGTPYKRVVEVDRERFASQVLERLFFAWRREAVLIEDYLPQSMRKIQTDWTHGWMWPGVETGNPKDEAPAATERMANGTSTLAKECAREGADWMENLDQQQREMNERKKRGLPLPSDVAAKPAPADDGSEGDGEQDDQVDEEDDTSEEPGAVDAAMADYFTAAAVRAREGR